jgi:hypothetical protein
MMIYPLIYECNGRKIVQSKLITPEILHIQFESQYLITSSFMRLQEFYESDIPGIVGCYFSREYFEDAYAKRFGSFTYYRDWAGFNVPMTEINKFVELFNDVPYEKERLLLEEIFKPGHEKVQYVIGTYQNKDELFTLKHEFSHALFAINEEYRLAGTAMVEKYFQTKQGKKDIEWMKSIGYCEKVLIDEGLAFNIERKSKFMKLFDKICEKLNIHLE